MNILNLPQLKKPSGSFRSRLLKVYAPVLLIGVFALFYQGALPHAAKASPVAVAAPAKAIISHGTVAAAAPVPTPPVIRTVPTCSADTQFQDAGEFNPAAGSSGLVQQIDAPYYHRVYGNTAQQLKSLSLSCPLVIAGDNEPYINAYTSYWLNWQFSYSPGEDNLCRVIDSRVLLHIRQALPYWQKTAESDPALSPAWDAYAVAVNNHENGHLQLDQKYAGQLLASLQNFPVSDCASIAQAANNMANGYLAQLNRANTDYDTATNHGETQGAIIP